MRSQGSLVERFLVEGFLISVIRLGKAEIGKKIFRFHEAVMLNRVSND